MPVRLVRAKEEHAEIIWKMQAEAFAELLKRYRDYDTNPGAEPLERIRAKLAQEQTFFYYIFADDACVGAIRVVDRSDGSRKRISPLPFFNDKRILKGFLSRRETEPPAPVVFYDNGISNSLPSVTSAFNNSAANRQRSSTVALLNKCFSANARNIFL